ncbi:MAG: hypothetical protein HY905_14040 [Deltaproteobacteria bacterium]|nr:hypothetical protein [Deltaproteobacteria bacterium]
MTRFAGRVLLAAALWAGAASCARKGQRDMPDPLPAGIAGWIADGPTRSFDRQTVFSYLDGGAEVYLAYGMTSLATRRYVRAGETDLVADLFQMATAAGAFGIYTFELEGPTIDLGQDAELAAGMLRFRQGRCFGTVRAERESPGADGAILELGRAMAAGCGADAPAPGLPARLPPDSLRPLSIRYLLGPELLAWQERSMEGNPLGLDAGAESVLARYGPLGEKTQLLVARCRDAAAAEAGVARVRAALWPQGDGDGFASDGEGTWGGARAAGPFAMLVRGAPARERAAALLETTARRLEVAR